jgi:O-antigen/teichoic acid export membrane protein
VAWHQGITPWSRLLAILGLVVFLGASSTVAMTGYVIASALVVLSQLVFFRFLFKRTANDTGSIEDARRWTRQVRTYGLPFAVWGIFTWLQLVSDRWALQLFASTSDVGLYVVLYQLGYMPILLLFNLITQLITPMFFQRAGNASDLQRMKQVYVINRRLTWAVIGGTVLATLAAAGLHSQVFQWLAAPEYQVISWLLPGVVLSGGLFAAGQLASIALMSSTESKSLLAPKLVTSVIGVILNLVGAMSLGILGVVGAGVIFSATYLGWVLYLSRLRENRLAD